MEERVLISLYYQTLIVLYRKRLSSNVLGILKNWTNYGSAPPPRVFHLGRPRIRQAEKQIKQSVEYPAIQTGRQAGSGAIR